MEKTFEKIDKNFATWEAGKPSDQGIFPQQQISGRQPRRPRKPQDVPPQRNLFDLHIFTTLVEQFIKDYQLDDAQITAARSILVEFKQQANDYKTAKKAEFAKVGAQREEAYASSNLDGIKKASAAHKKLLGPVYGLCAQMEGRLEKLLTVAQMQRHAERSKAVEEASILSKSTTKSVPKEKPVPKAAPKAGSKSSSSNDD